MVSEVETNPPDLSDIPALHRLLTDAFAGMAARIDPPSSMTRLSVDDLRVKLREEDLFLLRLEGDPVACLFGTVSGDSYHVGKLAVRQDHRRRGLARDLMAAAEKRARALGLSRIELQSRVELTENHATFRALGFVETGRTAHDGYDRPTSVSFGRTLD
jgi:GNAT superfamily N-acetyltransferase